jgi:hypothetical protein
MLVRLLGHGTLFFRPVTQRAVHKKFQQPTCVWARFLVLVRMCEKKLLLTLYRQNTLILLLTLYRLNTLISLLTLYRLNTLIRSATDSHFYLSFWGLMEILR